MLRLLKLPKSVQQYVIDKQLSMGHVRALLGLKDASQIEDVAKKAIQLHLSVRAVETLDKNMNEAHQRRSSGISIWIRYRIVCRVVSKQRCALMRSRLLYAMMAMKI